MAELRLEVLLEAERTGLTVSEVCRVTANHIPVKLELEIANDLWQIDATEIVCVDDTKASVVDLIDDHPFVAAIAGPAATAEIR